MKTKKPKGPFLKRSELRHVVAIELDGVSIATAELLQQEGELVIHQGLLSALKLSYHSYLRGTGKPPTMVRQSQHPEKWFAPKMWNTVVLTPSGKVVPGGRDVLLFFAIPKLF